MLVTELTEASHQSAVTLDPKELFYLAEMLGAKRLLGEENPFRGFLTEERRQEWEDDVKRSLISKGYLTQGNNGRDYNISLHVLSQISAASLAERACWVKYKTGSDTFEEYLHITDERIVKVERKEEDLAIHHVDDMNGVYRVCGALAGKMKWNDRVSCELPALMLSKRQFEDIVSQADALPMEQITTELAKITDDREGSTALAKCLKTCVAKGDIRFYVWNGHTWDTQNAQFINNDQMNWLIRYSTKDDEDWLIATPTPKQTFQDMLQMWFRQPSETPVGRQ